MKLISCIIPAQIVFLLLLAGCSPLGLRHTSPVSPGLTENAASRSTLKKELDGLIARELFPYSIASIKVVSLTSGSTLYETNSRLLMPAASLQKLFTAAAALSRLGPDHFIETSLAVDSATNTLYVKGCGDPLLKKADLKQMVGDLVVKLAPGGHYKLVGDAGCFDDAYWGSGWMWDDEPDPDATYLSALTVNRNTIRVTVSPGTSASLPVEVATEPVTSYVVIENSGKTAEPGGPCAISITRPAGDRDNHIRVTGSLARGCRSVSKRLTVWRPDMYFLTLLAEQLTQAGITAGPLALGVTPVDAQVLSVIRRPVGKIVSVMLKNSDNLSAENLLKYLAHTKSGQKGTAVAGAEIIKEYLRSHGIATDQMEIVDGSGMSRYNLTSADIITRLLVAASKDQVIFPSFQNALPLAGIDGTLVRRMKGTPVKGKLRAKTGTMKGVSALAGYTVSADGEPLAFAMIMQNFVGSDQRIHDLQDRMAVLLSTCSAGQKVGGYASGRGP